jgi:hypothetical protein
MRHGRRSGLTRSQNERDPHQRSHSPAGYGASDLSTVFARLQAGYPKAAMPMENFSPSPAVVHGGYLLKEQITDVAAFVFFLDIPIRLDVRCE